MSLDQQKRQLRAQVQRWAERIRVQPTGVYIQRMTNKWASCSSTGRLCFSLDLLSQPPDFQEVVIVHELLHLRFPNHGRVFKSLLSAYLPSWRRCLRDRRAFALHSCPSEGRGEEGQR